MKILHISDFHYHTESAIKHQQSKVVNLIINDIKGNFKPDFIFFTGDLVMKGNKIKDFGDAAILLLENLMEKLNFNKENMLLCPGNHDVNRDDLIPAIKTFMDTEIEDNRGVDKFAKNKLDEQYKLSLRGTKNYFEFIKDFYRHNHPENKDILDELYSCHYREIDGKKIGIATINTAWRSVDDNDYGNLWFPLSIINEILNNLKDVDCKILLLHHPISYLKPFIVYDIEDLIYQEFHFMLSGHKHKVKNEMQLNYTEGIFSFTVPAVLTKKGDGKIGYSMIDVDLDTFETKIQNRFLDSDNYIFYGSEPLKIEFPCSGEKQEQNRLRKTIREYYDAELIESNDIFISSDDFKIGKGFLELFETPVLKSKNEAELVIQGDTERTFNFDNLYVSNENYFIFGNDKSGKTSILKRIQLENLKTFSLNGQIPLYVDLKDFNNVSNIDFIRIFSKYLKRSQSDVKKILIKYKTRILLDNLNPSNELIIQAIIGLLHEYPNLSVYATAEQTLATALKSIKIDDFKFEKLFIYNIGVSQIRSLTKRFFGYSEEKENDIVKRLVNVFKQLHMPFNFWTVSIFLWIFKKTTDIKFSNNAELIDLYIQNLLDRTNLALNSKKRFSYDNYIDYLSDLSFFMYKNYKDNNYRIEYEVLVQFTADFIKKNERIVGKVEEVLGYIFEKRILKKKEDDKYIFRLNSIFEYFLAKQIMTSEKFRKFIVDNDAVYLSFKNELEIYAGFQRNDINFLRELFDKTKLVFKSVNDKYNNFGTPDVNLNAKIDYIVDFGEIASKFKNKHPLSFKEQDMLQEPITNDLTDIHTEVKVKDEFDLVNMNYMVYDRYLLMFSRIFRSLDKIDDNEFVREVFDFIVMTYCNMGFYLIDELKTEDLNALFGEHDGIEEDTKEAILGFFAYMIPLLIQIFLFTGIGHINIENIVKSKIRELEKDSKNNQYLLFLLTFLLIDLDISSNKSFSDDLIEKVKIGVLKSCILFKFSYYYVFKSYPNPELEKYFRDKLIEQEINLNPKLKKDRSELNKIIESKTKAKLLNQKKNKSIRKKTSKKRKK